MFFQKLRKQRQFRKYLQNKKDSVSRLQEIAKPYMLEASDEALSTLKDAVLSEALSEYDATELVPMLIYCCDIEKLKVLYAVTEQPEGQKRNVNPMDIVYGAIYGDVAGSRHEGKRVSMETANAILKDIENGFCTDDSALTIATLSVLQNKEKAVYAKRPYALRDICQENHLPFVENPYTKAYRAMAKKNPYLGYGSMFTTWMYGNNTLPYGSYGNGSAMRISPVGAFLETQEDVIQQASISAMSTHNHADGIRGAVVTAMCIWMARNGYSKEQMYRYVQKYYGEWNRAFDEFSYVSASNCRTNQVECSYSVPASFLAFYESESFEDAIKKAICVGFDTDTNACICGGIASAFYGISDIVRQVSIQKIDELKASEEK